MAEAVLDSSATIAWLFNETVQPSPAARIQTTAFLVPWLWRLEVVNVLMVNERRKRIDEEEINRFLRALKAIDIEIVGEPADRDAGKLLALARPHQLTAYDAVYLDLAIRRRLPLYTFDGNLRAAATRSGVELFD